jgi:hypothetical protein
VRLRGGLSWLGSLFVKSDPVGPFRVSRVLDTLIAIDAAVTAVFGDDCIHQ